MLWASRGAFGAIWICVGLFGRACDAGAFAGASTAVAMARYGVSPTFGCEEGVLLDWARVVLGEEERWKTVNVKWRENKRKKRKEKKERTKSDRDATTSLRSAAGRGNGAKTCRCRTEKVQLQNGYRKSVVEHENKGREVGAKRGEA